MHHSTLIGLAGSVLLLIGMLVMSPENIAVFFNIPGLLLVVGGTLLATLMTRPAKDVSRVLRDLPQQFRQDPASLSHNLTRDINQLLQFARRYRYGSVRIAEHDLAAIHNPFLRASLRRVVDNEPMEHIVKSMQWLINGVRSNEQNKVQIVQTMASFAPAFGMLGTLFGLVQMLSGLGNSGLNEIGGTMAFAMITTVYGIIISNLLFKPLAIKMERNLSNRLLQLNALQEGVLQILNRRHPTLIRESMEAIFSNQPLRLEPERHLALVKEA